MLCYSIFIVYLLLFILIYKLTNLLDKTYTWNLCGPVPLWGTLASSVVLVVLGGVPTVVLEAGSPEIPARSKRGTRPLQKCQNGGFMLVSWWVVDLPLWKMMELVSWDDDIPNIWGKNHVPNHQPVSVSLTFYGFNMFQMHWHKTGHQKYICAPDFQKFRKIFQLQWQQVN